MRWLAPQQAERDAVDWSCASCRYDLRGTTIEDCCPECGRMVRSSRVHDVVHDEPACGASSRMIGLLAVAKSFTMVGGFFLGVCAVRTGRRAVRDASRFGVRLGMASISLSVLWTVGICGMMLFA